MSIRFPYERIDKGDKVLIYGAGELGQSMLWELRDNRYCSLAGITDKRFSANCKPPFYQPEEIPKITFDKVVIASLRESLVMQIKGELEHLEVDDEKIVVCDELKYPAVEQYIPQKELAEAYLFYNQLFSICKTSQSAFAGDFIYQSHPGLALSGQRDSEERISAYDVASYLKKTDCVLDIGCNCGMLDLMIAEYVHHITGVDIDAEMVHMANVTRDYLHIENADFYQRDLFSLNESVEDKYDAVCCFAIHLPVISWGGVSPQLFVETISKWLKRDGILFFESHLNMSDDRDELFEELLELFQDSGYELLMLKRHYGKKTGNVNRDITVFRHLT